MCEKLKEFKFICMDKTCMKQGQHPCVLSFYGEHTPDYPSYCPYEFEPSNLKYKPWSRINE